MLKIDLKGNEMVLKRTKPYQYFEGTLEDFYKDSEWLIQAFDLTPRQVDNLETAYEHWYRNKPKGT